MKIAIAPGLALCLAFAPAAGAQVIEYSASAQPNLAQIGVSPDLHAALSAYIANSAAAQNVGIAILDGLADINHPDLAGRLSVSAVYGGSYWNADLHGTHVAGIAGASRNDFGIVGVAPTARLISIPVFDDYGWLPRDNGKRALDEAQRLGAKVVNMSYGPTVAGDVFLNGELRLFDDYLNSMVLVRAAGNDGRVARHENYLPSAAKTLSHLLIVGSVDGNNTISAFSNRPGEACIAARARCTNAQKMKNFFIVAPGDDILSDAPGGGLEVLSGTSMATPHVSGAAALVFQEALAGNTVLTPTQVANILKFSATDLGARGVDGVYGWGLLNVAAALGPVGPTQVATANTVENSSSFSDTRLTVSSAMARSGALEGLLSGMVVFDGFGRGFVMNDIDLTAAPSSLAADAAAAMGAAVNMERQTQEGEDGASLALYQFGSAAGGFTGMSFASAGYQLSSGLGDSHAFFTQGAAAPGAAPSEALGRMFFSGAGQVARDFGSGFHSAADVEVAGGLTLSALYAHGSTLLAAAEPDLTGAADENAGASDLAMIGSSFGLGKSASLALGYGVLRESDSLLGMESEGAFALAGTALTQLAGVSYSQHLAPGFTLSGFAQAGLTSGTEGGDTVFEAPSDIWSSKMGLSLAAAGVVQPGDSLQLSLVSPWRIVAGDVSARIAVGRELDGTVLYDTRTASLAPEGMPLDLGLSYAAHSGGLSYGASLWLRDADATTTGLDEVAAAAALSWRF